MSPAIIAAALWLYVLLGGLAYAITGRVHDAVWWPLAIVKFLWRTLYRAVTEGWRP